MVSSSQVLGSQEDQVPFRTLRLVGGAAASPEGRAHSVGLPLHVEAPAPCAPALASQPHPPSPGPALPWDPGRVRCPWPRPAAMSDMATAEGGGGERPGLWPRDRAPTSPGAAGQTRSPPAHLPRGTPVAAPGSESLCHCSRREDPPLEESARRLVGLHPPATLGGRPRQPRHHAHPRPR